MRDKFDSYLKQGYYITRLIKNYTDLQKLCQYCGKPAELKNNRQDPYKIQFVCKSCRKEKNLNLKKDEMYDDIPLINVKEHLTSDIIKSKIIKLTPEIKTKLEYLLTSNLTKEQAIKYMNMTKLTFNRIINLYSEEVDNNYKDKLNEIFKINRIKIISKSKIKSTLNNNTSNNLSKIKYEKNISNNSIIKLSNNKITSSTISNICTGKRIPEIKTKCLLAEILDVSVADIFPDDWLFSKVKNYNDFLELNNWLRINFNIFYMYNKKIKNHKIMKEVSNKTNISLSRLFEFKNNNWVNLNHTNMLNLIKLMLSKWRLNTNDLVPDLSRLLNKEEKLNEK